MTDTPLRLVIFGRQGAGKGTQCERLAKRFNLIHLSTGEMFRAERDANTELGQLVAPIMESGGLVNDELTMDIVRDRLAQRDAEENGFVLDGIPRTPAQADSLFELLKGDGIHAAINLEVPSDIAKERMYERGREDDTDELIAERLALYESETVPTIKWFAESGLLIDIDGVGPEDEISRRIFAELDSLLTSIS